MPPKDFKSKVTRRAYEIFRGFSAIITLLSTLVAGPAGSQGYGATGKSTLQGTAYFVSGGSDNALTLNYRMTDTFGLTTGFESATAGTSSGTAYAVGFRYFPPVAADAKAEPYLFGGFVTATIATPGFAASSGSGVQLGIGGTSRVSDAVTLNGSVTWTSIAGGSSIGYTAGLQVDVSETSYAALGISGGGGTSAFYLGVGKRF